MHDDRQHEILGCRPVQNGPEGQVLRHVESAGGSGRDRGDDLGGIDVDDVQMGRRRVGAENVLLGPIAVRGEHGAQRLVPRQHVTDRSVHCLDVETACQSNRERDVVGGRVDVELVDEPHSLLSHRQRNRARARLRSERRTARGTGRVAVHSHRQRLDRGCLEQRTNADSGVEGCIHPSGEAGGAQRVSTEIEEARVDADAAHAENLAEDVGDDSLGLVARSARVAAEVQIRGGQRLSIELARGRERDRLQGNERRRNHVCRKRTRRPSAQRRHIDFVAGPRKNVGDQDRASGRSVDTDRRSEFDCRIIGQHRVDLAELDTETAHLDLEVAASDVLEGARLGPPHDVAGSVHTLAGLAERVRDEPLRRQTESRMVATRQGGAGEVELSCDTDRYRMQTRIQHYFAETDCRRADIDGRAHVQLVTDGGEDGGLRGAVRIEHAPARCPPCDELGRTHVATGCNDAQFGQTVGVHRGEGRGSHERMRDVLLRQELAELHAAVDGGGCDHHRGGTRDHHGQLENGCIEAR
ncbi:unannotated protein [freshwater metagenome]|uniref:Unannotated protein n=1 Tax=freshwater metagenome TaxID=449393 RepID=A0A6J7EX33_9ZZZZ